MDGHRRDFNDFSIFIVTAVLSDFANINFWIEVRSKSFAMVTSVAVDNIQSIHFIEMVFFGVCGIDIGHSRVKRSEERRVGKECRSRWLADYYKKKIWGCG